MASHSISFHQIKTLGSYTSYGDRQDKHFRRRSQPYSGGAANSFLRLDKQLLLLPQGARPRTNHDVGLTWSRLIALFLAIDEHSEAKGQLERAACLPYPGAGHLAI